jgi:hypothetical protein
VEHDLMDITTIRGALDIALNDSVGTLSRAYTQVALNWAQAKGDVVKARASVDASIAVLQDAAALMDNVLAAQNEIATLEKSGGTLTVDVPVSAIPIGP